MTDIKRIDWIDLARAFAIIDTLICHSFNWGNAYYSFFMRFLASFVIPFWFFISGYTSKNYTSLSDLTKSNLRVIRKILIIPSLAYFFAYIIVFIIKGNITILELLGGFVWGGVCE